MVLRCLGGRKREAIATASGGRFREALAGEHGIEHGAIVGSFAGGHDEEDIGVVGKAAEEDIELRGFGMHDDEAGRGWGGEGIAGGAVLEGLHDIGETLVAVVDGIEVADLGRDRGDGEESRTLEQNDFLGVNLLSECCQEAFDDCEVRDELVHDPRPRLV